MHWVDHNKQIRKSFFQYHIQLYMKVEMKVEMSFYSFIYSTNEDLLKV